MAGRQFTMIIIMKREITNATAQTQKKKRKSFHTEKVSVWWKTLRSLASPVLRGHISQP